MAGKFTSLDAADIINPTEKENLRLNKKKVIFPTNRGHFVTVKCGNCETEAICYSHTQKNIECKGCENTIWNASGGRGIAGENCTATILERRV